MTLAGRAHTLVTLGAQLPGIPGRIFGGSGDPRHFGGRIFKGVETAGTLEN